jgi:hypothetical protein
VLKKTRWILSGVLAAMLLSLCFFGIRLRIAPRLILSRALGTALEQLEERFENSPVHLISDALDPKGCQQFDLQLETVQDPLGAVRYDMRLHSQLGPNRIHGSGTVIAGGKALDLSLYLDGDFAAVSSQSLVEGSYYGITYDTFSEDIRSRQFLAALIGDKTISQWEASVSSLDAAMSRDMKLPEWNTKDVVSALYGVLALKPRVSRVDTPTGAFHAVTFQASLQDIAQAADSYRDNIPAVLMNRLDALKDDPAADACVKFLLNQGKLVQIQAELNSASGHTDIFLDMGLDPKTSQLNLEINMGTGKDASQTRLEVETASDAEAYREKLRFSQRKSNVNRTASVDYVYDLSTGEMDLSILRDAGKAQLRLNLAGEEDSLTVRSQNAAPLLNLFLVKPMEAPAICTITVSPGREVAVPEYRSLGQWSMEDLFALLAGLGGLLGLKLP